MKLIKNGSLKSAFLYLSVILLSSGCALENIVKKSAPVKPDWILRTKKSENGMAFYVGRALAENVLDEKGAMAEAMNNAATQIARTIYTEIDVSSTWKDSHRGDEVWGRETRDTQWNNQEDAIIKSIVSGLRPVETYFEKWWVKEDIWDDKIYKYRYWVLVSYPEHKLLDYQAMVKKNKITSGRY